MIVTAKDLRDKVREVLDTARSETVIITRHSKPEAAVISAARLEELESFEDRYWLEESRKGRASGSMGVEASEAYLAEIMNAED
jgi:prevent-host-death family protein